jgi:hypothetical protein
MDQRGAERVGEVVEVLVEESAGEDGRPVGRAAHQGPDVDGVTVLDVAADVPAPGVPGPGRAAGPAVGDLVRAEVIGSAGADLVARVLPGREGRR